MQSSLSCFVSASCWLFCFIAAIDIQILGLSRQLAEKTGDGENDMIAGHLPTLSSLFHRMYPAAFRVLLFGILECCTANFIASYLVHDRSEPK